MTYASQQDLIIRFGEEEITQLSDRNRDGAIDVDVLTTALNDADHEIDSYLAGNYILPLPEVPPLLVRLAADIARYRLFDDVVPDEVRNRYTDAVRLLRGLADGSVSLGISTASAPGATGEVIAVVPSNPSNWSRSPNGGIR